MQYQGGKERIARHLSEAMLERRQGEQEYLEPFLGGGSVFARMAPYFARATGADLMPDLVTMWDAAANRGWEPPLAVSRDEYAALRTANDPADPRTAFAAFGLSFGGKRWGGYASNRRGDDFAGAAGRSVVRRAAGMRGARFTPAAFTDHSPAEGVLVYADPPYAGTTGYSGSGDWDPVKFWAVMDEWSEAGALVFVSEYAAPDHWTPVWTREKRMTLEKGDNFRMARECLFVREG